MGSNSKSKNTRPLIDYGFVCMDEKYVPEFKLPPSVFIYNELKRERDRVQRVKFRRTIIVTLILLLLIVVIYFIKF